MLNTNSSLYATIVNVSPNISNEISQEAGNENANSTSRNLSFNEITLANQNQSSRNLSATGEAFEISIMPEEQNSDLNSPRIDAPRVQGFFILPETDSSSRNLLIKKRTTLARVLTLLGTGVNTLGITVANTDNHSDSANGYMLVMFGAMTYMIAGGLYIINRNQDRNQDRQSNPNTSPVIVLDPNNNFLGIGLPLSQDARI